MHERHCADATMRSSAVVHSWSCRARARSDQPTTVARDFSCSAMTSEIKASCGPCCARVAFRTLGAHVTTYAIERRKSGTSIVLIAPAPRGSSENS